MSSQNITFCIDKISRYYIRIGMNLGTVLFEDNDVFGNCVNIASRVQAAAPPEHIYITGRLYDAIRGDKDIQFRLIGSRQLRGVKEETDIYEIAHRDNNDPKTANSL